MVRRNAVGIVVKTPRSAQDTFALYVSGQSCDGRNLEARPQKYAIKDRPLGQAAISLSQGAPEDRPTERRVLPVKHAGLRDDQIPEGRQVAG